MDKDLRQSITDRSNDELLNVIGKFVTLKPKGKDHVGDCPFCNKKDGLNISVKKAVWKCFKCDQGGKGALSFLQEKEGMSYMEAVEWLGKELGIATTPASGLPSLTGGEPTSLVIPEHVKGNGKGHTFRDEQLKASGISNETQKYMIRRGSKSVQHDRFRSGSFDDHYNVIAGNDMLMYYVDLDREQMTYIPKGKSKPQDCIRVRYQFPEHHKDKHGKPKKYGQPADSGVWAWLPEPLIDAYEKGKQIETLFIDEGEKKATKRSQHGMFSIGIGGINNLASKDSQLPRQFSMIIEKCGVKNVVFWLDADWQALSTTPDDDKPENSRAWNFYYAIKNFRDYFHAFVKRGIYLNIFFGHGTNPRYKGIDDLMVAAPPPIGTPALTGADLIREDIIGAMAEKTGTGTYVQLHKITEATDTHIIEMLYLDDSQRFIEHHKEELRKRWPDGKVFKVGQFKWRFTEEGEVESATKISPSEQFWKIRVGRTNTPLIFSYSGLRRFLRSHGFGRLRMEAGWKFIQHEEKIVAEVEYTDIKDYVVDFTEDVLHEEEVLEMILGGSVQYLGPHQLGNMYPLKMHFVQNDQQRQFMFFEKTFWEITATGIERKELKDLPGNVWKNKLIEAEPTFMGSLVHLGDVKKQKDHWEINPDIIEFNPALKSCHFFQFLWNTSNFYWRIKDRQPNDMEMEDTLRHLFSKLTAIGYLLHQYRDPSIPKIVVAMDGKMSSVGSNKGRTGKSLFGEAIRQMLHTFTIPGREPKFINNPHLLEGVDERTDLIFVNDLAQHIPWEFFYNWAEGKFTVNPKGKARYEIPPELSPKVYISTNHAIRGSDDSDLARQHLIGFSDYYNKTHQPVDDFEGLLFFDDWDHTQWSLFYNLMATCIHLYLKHGLLAAPGEHLEKRKLRQDMGEDFLEWAEKFFADPANRNCRIEKDRLYGLFCKAMPPKLLQFNSKAVFKKKVKMYCRYATQPALYFNPHRLDEDGNPGGDYKTGGSEYFIITDREDIREDEMTKDWEPKDSFDEQLGF